MVQFLKKQTAFLLLAGLSLGTQAQKKPLTDDQYFKSNFKGLTQALPNAGRWVDNNNLLLIKDGKTLVLDAKNGTEREQTAEEKTPVKMAPKPQAYIKNNNIYFKSNDQEVQLTFDDVPEVNPTLSPDGK
jgi:hypothetical protein